MAVAFKNGRWYIVHSTGKKLPSGNYEYKWIPTVAATDKKSAQKEEEKFLANLKKGIHVDPEMLVKDLFALWMEKHVKAEKDPKAISTQKWYQDKIDTHIIPVIGDIRVIKLTILDLDEVLNVCAKNGGRDTTLQGVYRTMSACFGWATKKRVIDENLMLYIDKPSLAEREYVLLKSTDFPKFIEAAKNAANDNKFGDTKYAKLMQETYYVMFLVELTTGMRADELCGLREEDLFFEEKYIYIRQQVERAGTNPTFSPTKGKRMRKVPMADLVAEALRLELERKKERKRNSPKWTEYGLVFTNRYGGPIDSGHLDTRVLKRILKVAGLPPMRFHNLRHSVGTALAEANEDPNAICDLLGHSDPYFTKRQYIHAGIKSQQNASKKLVGFIENKI